MAVDTIRFGKIKEELESRQVRLVAVSKTKPVSDILELYNLGQRHFGENYVQELTEKNSELPPDIRWHFIGHLQSNKVKFIAPFVHLIHGVDSLNLLQEINKQGLKLTRRIDCLLQVHIAREETKFGFSGTELATAFTEADKLSNVRIRGLMGMASFTEDQQQLAKEFADLNTYFQEYKGREQFTILSMGMSGDYQLAIENGSTLVRIGSLLFGAR